MEYTIREMRKSDWSDVLEIYYQGIQTNMATFETQCPSYEEWDRVHGQVCRYVIETDGDVVGWAALSPVSQRQVYRGVAELSIYINVDNRGKGLGKALLEHLTSQSELYNFWTLESLIMEENLASIALHQSCGFRKVGYRERMGKDRFGSWRNIVLMEHRIQSDKAGGCDCDLVKNGGAEPGSIFYTEPEQEK